MPRTAISLEILKRIERRYRLPDGYFAGKMGSADRVPGDFNLDDTTPVQRRRLAWHLPEDFNRRPRNEQAEIDFRKASAMNASGCRAAFAQAVRPVLARADHRWRSCCGDRFFVPLPGRACRRKGAWA